jgi:uncharacterized protein (TIGR03067 family)
MRRLTILLAVLVVPPAETAPKLKDPPTDDRRLVGTWVAEKVVVNGLDVTAMNRDFTYTFTATGAWVIRGGDDGPARGYVAGTGGKPPTIDLYADAAKRDKVMKGIYRLTGDALTLCIGEVDADRPSELRPDPAPTPPERPGVHYFEMRRVPAKD